MDTGFACQLRKLMLYPTELRKIKAAEKARVFHTLPKFKSYRQNRRRPLTKLIAGVSIPAVWNDLSAQAHT